MVWPVADPGASAPRRAARARASRFGPAPTSTRTASNRAPSRAAAPATTSASAAEPGRKPWSTWTAVTSHPAAVARTRRARESGPPETAQVRGLPTGGKVQAPSSVSAVTTGARLPPGLTPAPAPPPGRSPWGRSISLWRGEPVRCGPPRSRDGGSRPWWEASRAPPTLGSAARAHRWPPRRG